MAFTSDDLVAIEKALKSGTKKVKYADKEVEYQSIDDLLKVRDLIRLELGQTSRLSVVYPILNKGLEP